MALSEATAKPTRLLVSVAALFLLTSCGAGRGVTRRPEVGLVTSDAPTPATREVEPSDAVADSAPPSNESPDSAIPTADRKGPTRPPLPSVAEAPGEIVLYNPDANIGRSPSELLPNSNVVSGDELPTEEQKRVVDALFPGRHLTIRQCPEEMPSDLSLKGQRAAGYFSPSVAQAVAGSFTAPRTKEKLYLVWVGECNGPRSYRFGTSVLAVLRDDTLVSRVPLADEMTTILLTSDLDGDGRDEILLFSDYDGGGLFTEDVEVVRMDASRLTVLKGWTSVDDATECGLGGDYKSSILYVTRGAHPRFRVETKVHSCYP
jgi:hypothetical protein